jgi:hypothetical protein
MPRRPGWQESTPAVPGGLVGGDRIGAGGEGGHHSGVAFVPADLSRRPGQAACG